MLTVDDPKAQRLIAKVDLDLASDTSADVLREDLDAIDALHNDGSEELRANLRFLRLAVERRLHEQEQEQANLHTAQITQAAAKRLTPAPRTFNKPKSGPTRRR